MIEEIKYSKSENLLTDARQIVESAQQIAYKAVDVVLLQRNWYLGKRIAEECLGDQTREDLYGKSIISTLSAELTKEFGAGFTKSNLYSFVSFYKYFPDIFHTVRTQSFLLSWSHYRILLQVEDSTARKWYAEEAARETWSTRTLQRNISTQYYYRMLQSPHKDVVREEMQQFARPYQDKASFVKDPLIAEFLGLESNVDFTENKLENAIISNLRKFIMELGKGYAFVARQQHVHTEKEDYYIDLVFYNFILKCFVLIDLKTGKVTHQDVGQMDMYVRLYDELKRGEGDNPTIGILLCSDTDEDIARYSVLKGNEQLFATKYKLYLPTEEELRREIEQQKAVFSLQHAAK